MRFGDLKRRVNLPVFFISGGLLVLFVVMSFFYFDGVTNFVNTGFDLSIAYFGAFWQLLLLATFVVGVVLAISKYGKVRLGNEDKPRISFFKWAAILVSSGLGAGGFFGQLLNLCIILPRFLLCTPASPTALKMQ